MSRRIIIFALSMIFIVVATPSIHASGKLIHIVDGGKPCSVIVTSDDASDQTRVAAHLLSRYIKLSSNAQVEVFKVSELPRECNKIKLWVGSSSFVDKLNLNMVWLNDDGFLISFPDNRNIVIVGKSDWGTEFGVYDFCERYIGVRWLLPGSDGEYVPKHSNIIVPPKEVREQPAFFSREVSGLKGEAQANWARRMRIHGAIAFHHNLYHLFPPSKYTETHPEFFPVRNGMRYLPPPDKEYHWQPCFSETKLVDEAVKNICRYFSEHPKATSYSLGVNDDGGYCECEKCQPKGKIRKNILGYRDVSDLYFEWANAVVKRVLRHYPDKWFGCLAYSEVAQPPSKVKLHPRIIPYMTYDRMKWIDKDIETEGQRMTGWWARKASFIGWYDYIYGSPYCLPRVYFHKMAEYYRYAQAHNVRVMYAEAYPNWGEGPKMYVALKLLWNPKLDVDKLLNEWYVCAVGKEAAHDLAAYYNLWENFWTKRILRSKWFTPKGQYLHVANPKYLSSVTFQDISKSRELLESVVAKTKTKEQRARAAMLLRAFEYYEASVISYLGLVAQKREEGKPIPYYESMNRKRYELINEFEKDPLLVHPSRFDKRKELQWGGNIGIFLDKVIRTLRN